jgi:transposase
MFHTDASHADRKPATPAISDPEVVVKPKRRPFTADDKRRILQAAEACTQSGEVGALLRREGLYSSHLTTWRHQRQRGELPGLAPAKRGRLC